MADKKTLTTETLLKLSSGLLALDGLRSSKEEVRYFEFDQDVAFKIAEGQVIIEHILESYNRLKKLAAKKHGIVEGMPITEKNAAQVSAYVDEIDALKQQEREVELPMLKREDLNQKKNKIPPSVLRDLMTIIEE